MHDLVLRGARTIDPETALDAVCDVAIDGGTITAVNVVEAAGEEILAGRVEWDLTGRVLAPGFIDLHSHCNDLPSRLLQVCDGVTTALELEAGYLDVQGVYDRLGQDGSPNNFGASASWALARMAVCGLDVSKGLASFAEHIDAPAWHRPLTNSEHGAMLDALAKELQDGALGIGVLLGYCQQAAGSEYLEIAGLAAETGTPTFTHVREHRRPDSGLFGAQEVVAAALTTGAHMHLCHVNSTSTREVDRVHALLAQARRQGLRVTTEAYPYGAGATGIGAAFLHPDALPAAGLVPSDICYLPTGERPATAERLLALRQADPGGFATIDLLKVDDPADLGFLTRAFLAEDTAVASDAVPLVPPRDHAGGMLPWPPPPGTMTHPRTSGTFSRIFRWYVRELGILDLAEAVRRCTLVPAQVLSEVAPEMRRKGRVQAGADADLVVFDPVTIADQATYAEPTRASTGIDYVLVNGVAVIADGRLNTDLRPGRPVRGRINA